MTPTEAARAAAESVAMEHYPPVVHLPTDALDDIGMEGIRRHANHQREVGRGVLIETILNAFAPLLAERDAADNDLIEKLMTEKDILVAAIAGLEKSRDAYAAERHAECEWWRRRYPAYMDEFEELCEVCTGHAPVHEDWCPHNKPLPEVPT